MASGPEIILKLNDQVWVHEIISEAKNLPEIILQKCILKLNLGGTLKQKHSETVTVTENLLNMGIV